MEGRTVETARKIGLIGCGRIAQDHFKAIDTLESARLAAVCDVNEASARSVGEQYNCAWYTYYRDMIAHEELDAVVICTPPKEHAAMVKYALVNGLHVLCEKPFAIKRKEAEDMSAASRKSGKLLMMASKFRFAEDVVKTKAILESGLIGKVVLFENVFCSKVDMTKRWNSDKKVSGGGVLIDNGAHSADIARFLLGPIGQIQAQFGCQVQKMNVEDTARIYFRTKSKVMGTIDLSWSLNKDIPNYISIYGTEGTLHCGWKESKYKLHEKQEWQVFGSGYNKHQAFLSQMSNFVDCMNGVAKPIITDKDGLESVKVIETAYASSKVDKWMEVAG